MINYKTRKKIQVKVNPFHLFVFNQKNKSIRIISGTWLLCLIPPFDFPTCQDLLKCFPGSVQHRPPLHFLPCESLFWHPSSLMSHLI